MPFDGELSERAYAQFIDYNGDAQVLQEGGTIPNDGANGAVGAGERLINVPGWAAEAVAGGVADYHPSEKDPGNTRDDYGWVPAGGFLWQNIGTSVAGAVYTVNFEVTGFADETWAVQIIEGITPPGPGPGPSGAPSAGDGSTGTQLAANSGTAPATFTAMTTDPSLQQPAQGDLPLQIRLVNFSGPQVLFDNIVVTETPVPEPAALSLLGIAGLAALRRRRRSL